MKTGIVINPQGEREIRNFSFDDPEAQERIIDLIFVKTITQAEMVKAAMSDEQADKKVLERLVPLPTEQEEWDQRRSANEKLTTRPRTRSSSFEELAGNADPGGTLLGTATGGLPDDRKGPEEPEPKKEAKQEPKAAAKKEPVTS